MPRFDAAYVPRSALALYAHPDDLEFTVAGTIAKWTKAGCEANLVLITNGDAGTHDTSYTRESLARAREREQHEAARILGIREIVFLGHSDCELFATPEVRRELVREIRRFRPEVVLCADPQSYFFDDRYINHPDHRAGGEAALAATFPCAEMELLWPELGPAHKVHGVYISSTLKPNTWIDVTGTMDAKIEALSAHRSQVGDRISRELADMVRQRAADEARRSPFAPERAEDRGEAVGGSVPPRVGYAESFRVMRLVREVNPPG
jgi:LmbE family N-acetylglucosaminyl deacetylase